MNGMEMMFKSMGIDIEGIKQIINPETVKDLLLKLENVTTQLQKISDATLRIETKLNTLPNDEAMKLLVNGKELAEKETADYVRSYNDGNGNN